jgi:hypothetical protein
MAAAAKGATKKKGEEKKRTSYAEEDEVVKGSGGARSKPLLMGRDVFLDEPGKEVGNEAWTPPRFPQRRVCELKITTQCRPRRSPAVLLAVLLATLSFRQSVEFAADLYARQALHASTFSPSHRRFLEDRLPEAAVIDCCR